MGDNYEDLVELGIEGVDRVVDKYHDHIYGVASKPAHHFRNQRDKKRGQGQPPPPPPQDPGSGPRSAYGGEDRDQARSLPRDEGYSRRGRAQSEEREKPDRGYDGFYERGDRRDSKAYEERERDNMSYTQERRRYPRDWQDDGDRGSRNGDDNRDDDRGDERGYHAQRDSNAVAVRGRDANAYPAGYQVGRPIVPVPVAPYQYAQQQYYPGYADDRGYDRRPRNLRRSSSYDHPPRKRRSVSRERQRSGSPNHYRALATVVGALAGGFIASNVGKDKEEHGSGHIGTIQTVGGAIVGGIVARKGEEMWDNRREKKHEEEERRERRRRERDRYGY